MGKVYTRPCCKQGSHRGSVGRCILETVWSLLDDGARALSAHEIALAYIAYVSDVMLTTLV